MKRTSIFFLIFLNLSSTMLAQWVVIDSLPTTQNLYSVFFTDLQNGWVAGHNGALLKTTDGGLNWESCISNTVWPITSIFFIHPTKGWAVAGLELLKTNDSGDTWSNQEVLDSGSLTSIYFYDENNGWLVGSSGVPFNNHGVVCRSTNGGENWSIINLGAIPTSVSFADSSMGWIVCRSGSTNGLLLKTTDGGISWFDKTPQVWRTLSANNDNYLNQVYFINESNGWIHGMIPIYGDLILGTTDGGENWNIYSIPAHGAVYSFHFSDLNNGWAVGDAGTIIKTSNGGESWNSQIFPVGTGNWLRSVNFVDSLNGWAVGHNGVVLRTTDGGVTFIEETKIPPVINFNLEQNYPNPFNPFTKISYQIANTSFVSLQVYDLLGREVATLVYEEKPAGSYDVEFDGSNLPSGVYFYKLQSENYSFVKKMILMK